MRIGRRVDAAEWRVGDVAVVTERAEIDVKVSAFGALRVVPFRMAPFCAGFVIERGADVAIGGTEGRRSEQQDLMMPSSAETAFFDMDEAT